MQTFFYAATINGCAWPCEDSFCACRCRELLDALPEVKNLVVLPGGSRLKSSESLLLRSGDLLILYAADDNELLLLIADRKIFEPFRVVLILGKQDVTNMVRYHQLKPRYFTSLERNREELNSVIGKINDRRLFFSSSMNGLETAKIENINR